MRSDRVRERDIISTSRLQERVDGKIYHNVLMRALEKIRAYKPDFVVVALGLDPGKGDPTGTWTLGAKDFHLNGRLIAELRRPTVVVQEGGYLIRSLGTNARNFFLGFWEGLYR